MTPEIRNLREAANTASENSREKLETFQAARSRFTTNESVYLRKKEEARNAVLSAADAEENLNEAAHNFTATREAFVEALRLTKAANLRVCDHELETVQRELAAAQKKLVELSTLRGTSNLNEY